MSDSPLPTATMTSQPRDLLFYTTIGALCFEVWDCPPSPEAVRESLCVLSPTVPETTHSRIDD